MTCCSKIIREDVHVDDGQNKAIVSLVCLCGCGCGNVKDKAQEEDLKAKDTSMTQDTKKPGSSVNIDGLGGELFDAECECPLPCICATFQGSTCVPGSNCSK
ncbi:hypothetical protein Hypma_006250 [Hypsizygus marmoreus]|uniref:Uncharacterized protein n=1 Tax=Hypsizygus marmoreus TaxID=39966 RepID=A0A369JVE5_HYPMA|nr:hypothetical protein Hypma_006250 [Hypsizygus marmoreus]